MMIVLVVLVVVLEVKGGGEEVGEVCDKYTDREKKVDECHSRLRKVTTGVLVWGRRRQVIMGKHVIGEGRADGRTRWWERREN